MEWLTKTRERQSAQWPSTIAVLALLVIIAFVPGWFGRDVEQPEVKAVVEPQWEVVPARPQRPPEVYIDDSEFKPLTEAEFEKLKADLRKNVQITVDPDGPREVPPMPNRQQPQVLDLETSEWHPLTIEEYKTWKGEK